MNPLNSKEMSNDNFADSITISPVLPNTKEELLTLLREEERRRLSPEIQKQYHDVGSDPTSGKDWMDVTDQMQHDLVREFGYSDEAVQLLRRAPQLYPGKRHIHLLLRYIFTLTVTVLIRLLILMSFFNYSDDSEFVTILLILEISLKECQHLISHWFS